jgi:beta-galactosidase
VKFTVEGGDAKIIGVGNGDTSCHEPDKADQRSAFNGLCMAIIQARRTAGDIRIAATSDGLQAESTIVQAAKATPRRGL